MSFLHSKKPVKLDLDQTDSACNKAPESKKAPETGAFLQADLDN